MPGNRVKLPTEPQAQLLSHVEKALETAKKARRYRAALGGVNFYADKLANLRVEATILFRELSDPSVGDVSAMAEMLNSVFSAATDYKTRCAVARELMHELRTKKWRSATPLPADIEDAIFPLSLLAKTRRGYLLAIGRQMNGCLGSGWHDACAVMMRRLLETTVIEAFEANNISAKIKTAQGEFFQLTDLINAALAESSWNLSRNAKKALPQLRDIGHISAHSRRFTAQRSDITKVSQDCRVVIEEFLHLAKLLDGL